MGCDKNLAIVSPFIAFNFAMNPDFLQLAVFFVRLKNREFESKISLTHFSNSSSEIALENFEISNEVQIGAECTRHDDKQKLLQNLATTALFCRLRCKYCTYFSKIQPMTKNTILWWLRITKKRNHSTITKWWFFSKFFFLSTASTTN